VPVEGGINLHKQHRGVDTRYDKLALRYEATAQIAATNIWLRRLPNTCWPAGGEPCCCIGFAECAAVDEILLAAV
jgi:hypothetical protein